MLVRLVHRRQWLSFFRIRFCNLGVMPGPPPSLPPLQVCEGLERMVATFLPPLEPAEEGGEPRERSFETWAPKKTLKVWNPK